MGQIADGFTIEKLVKMKILPKVRLLWSSVIWSSTSNLTLNMCLKIGYSMVPYIDSFYPFELSPTQYLETTKNKVFNFIL